MKALCKVNRAIASNLPPNSAMNLFNSTGNCITYLFPIN